jgi:hypothetical protein
MTSLRSIILLTIFFLGFISSGRQAEASTLKPDYLPDLADFQKFLGEIQGLEPPQTIRLRITGDWPCDVTAPYTVVTIDFNTYVKNVLPNEWYYWWPEESLKAGAVAVKMFAWYWIDRGGKWRDADMTDNTCDQWFRYGSSHPRTDKAVDETWSWVLSRNGDLFETRHKNTQNCKPPTCIRQADSADLARQGYRWDEILGHFYTGSNLWPVFENPAGFNLRFDGSGAGQLERVLVPLDSTEPISWVNIGAEDFTLEWFMKAYAGENHTGNLTCGNNQNWIHASVIFDRDRPSEESRKYGVSLSEGRILFGAAGPDGGYFTLCGSALVGDGKWHHIAVQRRVSDGQIWQFVDGKLDTTGSGPAGDISFPAGAGQGSYQENYLVVGASRRDGEEGFQSYKGWLDEIRFSQGLRYPEAGFDYPGKILAVDDMTEALFRLDEGKGVEIEDYASPGLEKRTGIIHSIPGSGPVWELSDLFITYNHVLYLPFLQK